MIGGQEIIAENITSTSRDLLPHVNGANASSIPARRGVERGTRDTATNSTTARSAATGSTRARAIDSDILQSASETEESNVISIPDGTLARTVSSPSGCITMLGTFFASLDVCYEVGYSGINVSAKLRSLLGEVDLGSATIDPQRPSATLNGSAFGFKAEAKIDFSFATYVLSLYGIACAPFSGCSKGSTSIRIGRGSESGEVPRDIFGPTSIEWKDLTVRGRLRGDVIRVREEDLGDPGRCEFALELRNAVAWWKGLQRLNDRDQQVDFIETYGRGSSAGPMSVELGDVEVNGKLVLWKAGWGGLHVPTYLLGDLAYAAGKRITFLWDTD